MKPNMNPSMVFLADGERVGRFPVVSFDGLSVSEESGVLRVAGSDSPVQVSTTSDEVTTGATTDETTFSDVSIAAGEAWESDGRTLTVRTRGELFNNGSTRLNTLRVMLEETVVWQDDLSLSGIVPPRPYVLDLTWIRRGSVLRLEGHMMIGQQSSVLPDVGTGGGFGAAANAYAMLTESLAVDFNDTVRIRQTWQQASATANMVTTRKHQQVLRW